MNPRLPAFLARCAFTIYPEPLSPMHSRLTEIMAQTFAEKLPPGASLLDVGCGQGPALAWFTRAGFRPVGIALGKEDAEACITAGFYCEVMDQNDMTFPACEFDAVWARHVLEHSPIPFFTLTEFFRVLKPGGWLYVEMPCDGTDAWHTGNRNHFSVMSERMLASLLERAGFDIDCKNAVCTGIGPFPLDEECHTDRYFAFQVQKPNQPNQ